MACCTAGLLIVALPGLLPAKAVCRLCIARWLLGLRIQKRENVGNLARLQLHNRGIDAGIAVHLRFGYSNPMSPPLGAVTDIRSEKFIASEPKSSPLSSRFFSA